MSLRFSVKYFIAVLITIFMGIGSRKISFLPAETGDALYAVMIFFLLNTFFYAKRSSSIPLASFVICVLIELSQLIQTAWLNSIRFTKLGALVLGNGFLWIDILAYAIGVLTAFWIAKRVLK
jgi:hypothetical protein